MGEYPERGFPPFTSASGWGNIEVEINAVNP
jgi:hypothetical protein